MMKIVDIDKEFKTHFNRFRDLFSLRQFYYFSIYVYALIVLDPEQKTVTGISSAYIEPICRSSLERLLCDVSFDFSKVINRSRSQLFRRLSNKKRKDRHLKLVLDDTTLVKFGQKIFGTGWYKKNKKDPSLLGIQVVVIGALVENLVVPIDFRIYVQEHICENIKLKFETKLEQASSMLKNIKRLPKDYDVQVMFDAWYLNEQVTSVIDNRGWTWVGRIASNRNILPDGEEKRVNLANSADKAPWQPLHYKSDRKRPAAVGHQRMGNLKGIGRVKVVMSSLVADGSEKRAFFCTNCAHMSMVSIIKMYEKRWKIEVFFKEARKCFALGRWQVRAVTSVVHHLCLVIVAAIACACIRLDELDRGEGDSAESWGAFTRRWQSKNKRAFLKYFLENKNPKDDNDFNEICNALGI